MVARVGRDKQRLSGPSKSSDGSGERCLGTSRLDSSHVFSKCRIPSELLILPLIISYFALDTLCVFVIFRLAIALCCRSLEPLRQWHESGYCMRIQLRSGNSRADEKKQIESVDT
jgi:hypothetical protein